MAAIKEPDAQTPERHPDPITGAPGSHPIGVGVGAASAAAAGAAVGAAAGGPIGAAVGTVVGAVAGGLAGKELAEQVNPTVEDAYWQRQYSEQPYARPDSRYEDLRPAYQYGWESYAKHGDRRFEDAEPEMREEWEKRNERGLSWDEARAAARDAWRRLEQKRRTDE